MFKEFILNNKCRILSWIFGVCSAWFGCCKYNWEKSKICDIEWDVLSFIIPFIISGVLQGVHLYLERKNTVSIREMETKLRDFNSIKNAIPAIIHNFIFTIYENLDLGVDDRITLFLPCDDGFSSCSRYSHNSKTRPIRLTKYKRDRGVIQKIWDVGWWFDNHFPSPSGNKKYQKYQKEHYNLSKTDVANLSMKAVLYCGKRIDDSSNRTPIAVLIIESTNKNSFNEEDMKKKLEKEIEKLIPLLENETIRKCIPNQSIIDKEEGF